MINVPAHPPFMQLLIYFRHDLKASANIIYFVFFILKPVWHLQMFNKSVFSFPS
jgi:hypothetical protein